MTWPSYSPQPPLSNAWYVEPTRVTNVVTGQQYTTLLYQPGTAISRSNAIAEAVRRSKIYAGIDQRIYLANGETFDAPQIQGADSGKADSTNYGFWGSSTNGPFQPVNGLFFVTNDLDPAHVEGTYNFGNKIKAGNGAITTPPNGSFDRVYWYGVNFHLPFVAAPNGIKHHWTSVTAVSGSHTDVQGSVGAIMCSFTGDHGWVGSGLDPFGFGYDCKTPIRCGFASWKMHNNTFPTCGEHVFYFDAPQGHCELWYNSNTSVTGTAGASTGNTFCQIPQRGLNPLNPSNHGGLPGQGYISIIGNTTYGVAFKNPSSNITIVGFLGAGGVLIQDHTSNRNYGGEIVFWSAAGDGGFTTLGPFDPLPNPNNYPQGAYTTRSAIVRNYTSNLATPWLHPTAPLKFSGVESVEIENFSIANLSGQRAPFAFWDVGNETNLNNDPWDNGAVLFRCPPVTIPVSQYAAFAGISGAAKKARWKNSTTHFTDAELDALANRNSAYPPGGPPPPPPNTPLFVKGRGGHRARAIVLAPNASAYVKARSGMRARAVVVDHPYTAYVKVRSGFRARAVVVDMPTQTAIKSRSGFRAKASMITILNTPIQQPPRPSRIYREAGEILAAGSEAGFIAAAGTAAGQVVTNDA